MSPMPSQLEDHWVLEQGTDPGRAQLMWFMCCGSDPVVTDLARLGRARLAAIDGLDLVPSEWLHITTLIAGYADEIPATQVASMTAHARALLRPRLRFRRRPLDHPRRHRIRCARSGPHRISLSAFHFAR